MNNTKNSSINRLRADLVTELLKVLEDQESIAEALACAEALCSGEVTEKIIIKAKPQIMALKEMYSQKKMKDDEVKTEISKILLMIT